MKNITEQKSACITTYTRAPKKQHHSSANRANRPPSEKKWDEFDDGEFREFLLYVLVPFIVCAFVLGMLDMYANVWRWM